MQERGCISVAITQEAAYDEYILQLLEKSYEKVQDQTAVLLSEDEFWAAAEEAERCLRSAV